MALGSREGVTEAGARDRAAIWVAGAAVLLLWAGGALAVLLLADASPGGLRLMLGFIALSVGVLVPLAAWALWRCLGAAGALRSAASALRDATAEMEHARVQLRQAHAATPRPEIEGRLGDIAGRLAGIEERLAHAPQSGGTELPAQDTSPEPKPAPDGQGHFALRGEPAAPQPLAPVEIVRALNFPEDENDADGFRSLRRALADHEVARLVRAAQDVLTLLAQDGIYTDDLIPDRARPEIWRAFAAGQRGREVAALGGIRDRESLAVVSARLKSDPVFRDAAHHFLRQFDRSFATFAGMAADEDIVRLAETRTARAFMLLGRATGIFT